MATILAQADISQVPADFTKNLAIWGIVFVVLASAVSLSLFAALQYFWDRRRSSEVQRHEIANQPLEVGITRTPAKRYNHDAIDHRFITIEGTVDRHEGAIRKIEDRLGVDLPAMERRLDDANEQRVSAVHNRVNDVLLAVGELTGEMKARNKK